MVDFRRIKIFAKNSYLLRDVSVSGYSSLYRIEQLSFH